MLDLIQFIRACLDRESLTLAVAERKSYSFYSLRSRGIG